MPVLHPKAGLSVPRRAGWGEGGRTGGRRGSMGLEGGGGVRQKLVLFVVCVEESRVSFWTQCED